MFPDKFENEKPHSIKVAWGSTKTDFLGFNVLRRGSVLLSFFVFTLTFFEVLFGSYPFLYPRSMFYLEFIIFFFTENIPYQLFY